MRIRIGFTDPVAVMLLALFVGSASGLAANTASGPPSLSWSPTTGTGTYDFGTQSQAVSRQFTLTNSGGSATSALTVRVSATPGPFTITADGCSAVSLGPKKSCKVFVRYQPSAPGASDGATLTASSPKPSAVSAKLTLKGAGARPAGIPLAIFAAGFDTSYTNTYAWTIEKSVDKTLVKQIGGTTTFNYTVTVTHDTGTTSNFKMSGPIQVFNSNVDSSNNPVPVTIDGVTDQLSDGTVCTVTNGGAQTLTQGETDFAYECDFSGRPQSGLSMVLSVSWVQQTLSNGALLDAGPTNREYVGLESLPFPETRVDDCVLVNDSNAGSFGQACVGDANPATYTYASPVTVPEFDCASYSNMATLTTNNTGATGSASKTVKVCGPARTGAFTPGFWKGPTGQAIITAGGDTNSVCSSGTWLRQYAPFQDLSTTATCDEVATYVVDVINAGVSPATLLKAKMLATALDVYFSDPALGGNKILAPAPIGPDSIDLTYIGPTYENVSAAFGAATSLSVSAMLTYAASQSNIGGSSWYGNNTVTTNKALDAFDLVNNQLAFLP
jgi:hypothetical protein